MDANTQDIIARSLARERGDADPEGRAAFASGRALDSGASEPPPVLTLQGEVTRNAHRMGVGGSARAGNLEMKLSQGGAIHGALNLQYLNTPLLDGLSKLRRDGSNYSRKFKVVISIEEV